MTSPVQVTARAVELMNEEKKCKRVKCQNRFSGEDSYCDACKQLYKHTIEITMLVNGNSNLMMTIPDFRELFDQAIVPVYEENNLSHDDIKLYLRPLSTKDETYNQMMLKHAGLEGIMTLQVSIITKSNVCRNLFAFSSRYQLRLIDWWT